MYDGGGIHLHTKAKKAGKLGVGTLVTVPCSLIARQKHHYHSLELAGSAGHPVDLVLRRREAERLDGDVGGLAAGADTVYTIGSLWDRGELIVSTLHRKLQTNPPTGGVAVAGETVVDEALRDAGLAVLRASGPWHGLAAVELKRPAPGEPAFLLEINPRMWGFGYLMTLAGLNVPALLVRMLAGREHLAGHIPSTFPPYAPARMVRTWQDIALPPLQEGDT